MDPITSGDRRSMAMKSVSRTAVDLQPVQAARDDDLRRAEQERHRTESSSVTRLDAEARWTLAAHPDPDAGVPAPGRLPSTSPWGMEETPV